MRSVVVLIVILVSSLANAANNDDGYPKDFLEEWDPIPSPFVLSALKNNATPINSYSSFFQIASNHIPLSGLASNLGFVGAFVGGGMVAVGQSSNANLWLNNNTILADGDIDTVDGQINTVSIGGGGGFALVNFFAPNANGIYDNFNEAVNFSNASIFFTPATGVSLAGALSTQGENTTSGNGATSEIVILIPPVSEPMTWLMLCIGVGALIMVSWNKKSQIFMDASIGSNGYLEDDLTHTSARKPTIMILGLRGFPEVQGGIESHVEQLAPHLAKRNLDVKVIVRSPYQPKHIEKNWNGISFIRIWSPKSKATEAIVHTFLGVLYAAIYRPDVLHIHGIGPALLTPLCKLFGLKVVVTHHGPDYDRQKWGGFAKAMLKFGEFLGMRMADSRIVISNVIANLVKQKHAMNSTLIHNGVNLPELSTNREVLKQFGLADSRYILIVSRLVPEKRHVDLIHAFNQAHLDGYKLVIVGGSDHPDDYEQSLHQHAKKNPNIVMTGFQRGENLKALYTFADLFVLPSSHEGLSIALLEALSYGLPVLVSDIPANTEVNLESDDYFEMGNVQQLTYRMQKKLAAPISESSRQYTRNWVSSSYNWGYVANQTVGLYKDLVDNF